MEYLLNKIKEFGGDKTLSPSLVLEVDGSGMLLDNVFDISFQEPILQFNSLSELYEKIKYDN